MVPTTSLMDFANIPSLGCNSMNLETVDWTLVLPASLGILIFVGAMLMMFTGIWTGRNR